MWQAYTEAGRAANPQHPDLARFAAEEALWALTTGLETNKSQGLVAEGTLVPHPEITELQPSDLPTAAYIRDCLDTTNTRRVQAAPSGSPFVDTPGGFRRVTATVKNLNGDWKVVALLPLDVGTCQKP
jgi:hypothetical protein